jgi:uncharacterized protein
MSKDKPYDYEARKGVRPVSWDEFHGLCKALTVASAPWKPEIILPIGRGGYYPGTLMAHILQIEVFPVRLSRRVDDQVVIETPRWLIEPPALVSGKRILIVDEMCSTGETITIVQQRVNELGASQARTAVLYAHTWGAQVPDYIGLITDELVMNPWDREIYRGGTFRIHPEYVEAFTQQGLVVDLSWLIPAPNFVAAKQRL